MALDGGLALRRALIGFSSPAGYSYQWPASRSINDTNSSPNPVLLGAMGLFLLYDELWFACESLCPQSMRHLDYVHFIDRDVPGLSPGIQGSEAFVEQAHFPGESDLNDMFPDGYEGMSRYFPHDGRVDNHTHGLTFLDIEPTGNCGPNQLALDLWLLSHVKHLDLDLVLNPVTAKLAFGGAASPGYGLQEEAYHSLRVADRVVSLNRLYDITGPEGPYHPCVEELRLDPTLVHFRRWLTDNSGNFNNRELADIESEIDAKVEAFTETALNAYIGRDQLRSVGVDAIKDWLLGLSGLSVPASLIEYLGRRGGARERAAYAFIGRSRRMEKRLANKRGS